MLAVASLVIASEPQWSNDIHMYVVISFILWFVFSFLFLIFGLASKAEKFMKFSCIPLIIIGVIGAGATGYVGEAYNGKTSFTEDATVIFVGCVCLLLYRYFSK